MAGGKPLQLAQRFRVKGLGLGVQSLELRVRGL